MEKLLFVSRIKVFPFFFLLNFIASHIPHGVPLCEDTWPFFFIFGTIRGGT